MFEIILLSLTAMNFYPTGDLGKITVAKKPIWHPRVIFREWVQLLHANKDFLLDIVGRYTVTIGGKNFDTICVMDIEAYDCGVISEQFLDKNGKTILWRRFNRDDWAIDRYKKTWSEQLPNNEKLTVNGKTYVHWYDCITDYIL